MSKNCEIPLVASCFLSLVCRGGGEGGVFRRGDIQIKKDFVNT
jgi:hypothetical protein